MLNFSLENYRAFNTLINTYNALSWREKRLIPSDLKTAIDSYEKNPTDTDLVQKICAFSLKISTQQRLPILIQFMESPLIRAYTLANDEHLFNDPLGLTYFKTILKHPDPLVIVHALKMIKAQEAQANFTSTTIEMICTLLRQHQKPLEFTHAFLMLSANQLLSSEPMLLSIETLAQHPNPRRLAETLHTLKTTNLLTSDFSKHNVKLTINHPDPGSLNYALELLKEAQLLTQANFEALAQHSDIYAIVSALELLYNTNLFTPTLESPPVSANSATQAFPDAMQSLSLFLQNSLTPSPTPESLLTDISGPAYVKAVLEHPSPIIIAEIFSKILNPSGLLTGIRAQENQTIVINQHELAQFHSTLLILQEAGLLAVASAQANFDLLTHHNAQSKFMAAIDKLKSGGALSQENFEAVAKHSNPVLLASALCEPQARELSATVAKEFRETLMTECKNLRVFALALLTLYKYNLFQGQHSLLQRQNLAEHRDPSGVALILISLKQEKLLSEAPKEQSTLIQSVFALESPSAITEALERMRTAGALNLKNFKILIRHPYPNVIGYVLSLLEKGGFLKQKKEAQFICNTLLQCQSPGLIYLDRAFLVLEQAKLFKYFFDLIYYADTLFGSKESGALWTQISAQQLTATDLDAIIRVCKQNKETLGSQNDIRYYIQSIFGKSLGITRSQSQFNTAQSFRQAMSSPCTTPATTDSAISLSFFPSGMQDQTSPIVQRAATL